MRNAQTTYITPPKIHEKTTHPSTMDLHHHTVPQSALGYQSKDQSTLVDQSTELVYYNQQDDNDYRHAVHAGKQRQIEPPQHHDQCPEVNYSRGQYDDPAENMENYYQRLNGFLHSHEDPHYYNQRPYAHIDEYDKHDLPPDDVICDHDNEEDYYPLHSDNYDYPDDGSHNYHTVDNINELDENEYPHNRHYYPEGTYNHGYPTPDNDEPHFPNINDNNTGLPTSPPRPPIT
jgi:hypothetical protein